MPDNEILVEAHIDIPKAKTDIQEELNQISKELQLHISNINLNSKEINNEVSKLKENINKALNQSGNGDTGAKKMSEKIAKDFTYKFKDIESNTKDLTIKLQKAFGNIGDVTTSWTKDAGQNIQSFTATVKKYTGEIEKYKYQWQENEGQFTFVGTSGTDNATKKSLETQQKYLSRIRDEYKLISQYKKQLVNAGDNETTTLKAEIKKSQTRVSYYKSELKQRQLLTNEAQNQINVYKRLGSAQDTLTKARIEDNAIEQNAKQIERATIAADKYQTSLNNLYSKYLDKNAAKPIVDDGNISKLKEQYDLVGTSITELRNSSSETFNTMKGDVLNAIEKFKAFATQLQNAEYVANQLRAKTFAVVKQDEINKLDVFVNKIKTSNVDFNTMKSTVDDLKASLDNATNPKQLTEYLNKLSNANTEFNKLNSSAKAYIDNLNARQSADTLISRISVYKTNNTKALKEYGAQLDDIIRRAELLRDNVSATTKEASALSKEFMNVRARIDSANKAGKTLGEVLREKIGKFTGWFGISQTVMGTVQKISEMVQNVIDLDTAMTNLKKVTDETDAIYQKFLDDAIAKSKELHISLTDVINQSAEWAKQGYNINESSTLSQASGIYSVVGEVDNATAVQDLTTAMKSYKLEANDAIGIVDKLNNISNKYATTASDIGEILSNSASSLAVAGNSIDQNIAMGVAIREITGDASEAGKFIAV